MQLIFLPRGPPYLNVVKECRGLLKREVTQFYHYPKFDQFRWAVADYLGTARFNLDVESFPYRDPRQHLPAAK